METEIHSKPAGRLLQRFLTIRAYLRKWWAAADARYGNVIYGFIALTVIALFVFTFYLLKGMVQFI